MANRGRRAAGGVTVARRASSPGQPRISVRVRAGDPAAKAALIAALNDTPDISLIGAESPDVLVVAIDAPVPEPRRALESAAGALKPVLIVDHVDRTWVLGALNAGARAVLPRSAASAALIQAVRAVAAGLAVIHPDAVAPDDRDVGAFFAEGDPDAALVEPLEPLTERELQVLELLSDGLSNKAIARRLAISDHTVKFHLASVFSKLDAKTRAEALARGVRFGLVHL
jgi:two-component system, NarL family, response regulator YdfI